jgi:protein-tyrosine phosphatase
MRSLVAKAGLEDQIVIDSAGTGDWHAGELADPRTRAAASRRGLDLTHLARQFTRTDLDRFDLVIAMDASNLRHLKYMAGERATPELRLLRSFDPSAPPGADVPDPYAGGPKGFEEVLDQCERACAGLLVHVRERLRG